MRKKIAVLIRDRQEEGLRMAVGLTLKDDTIDVYVFDKEIEDTEFNRLNLETIALMDVNMYSNVLNAKSMEYLSIHAISEKLLNYDHIIPY